MKVREKKKEREVRKGWNIEDPCLDNLAESNNDSNKKQHWIFRTGWTPRPEQLEKMWCSNCGAYARKDLDRCIYCGIELIDG